MGLSGILPLESGGFVTLDGFVLDVRCPHGGMRIRHNPDAELTPQYAFSLRANKKLKKDIFILREHWGYPMLLCHSRCVILFLYVTVLVLKTRRKEFSLLRIGLQIEPSQLVSTER